VSRQTAGKTKMKTYKELKQDLDEPKELNESRFLRKGVSLVFARNAKKHGDDAVRHFKNAQSKLSKRPLDTPEERIERLTEGLNDLCEGMISLRKQNGALTGISTTVVLLNERTNQQLARLNKRK
jgi:hypothetical protein